MYAYSLRSYSLKMVYKLKVCMFMVKITSLAVNGYYPLTPILPARPLIPLMGVCLLYCLLSSHYLVLQAAPLVDAESPSFFSFLFFLSFLSFFFFFFFFCDGKIQTAPLGACCYISITMHQIPNPVVPWSRCREQVQVWVGGILLVRLVLMLLVLH